MPSAEYAEISFRVESQNLQQTLNTVMSHLSAMQLQLKRETGKIVTISCTPSQPTDTLQALGDFSVQRVLGDLLRMESPPSET